MILKKHLVLLFIAPHFYFTQVGINTSNPHSSAILEIDATKIKGGLLIPRVNLTSTLDFTTVPNPATGLLVYNLQNSGTYPNAVHANYIYIYSDNQWKQLTSDTDLINNNPDLPYVVGYGRKTIRTACNSSTSRSGIFNLDTVSDATIISSSGEFTAPKNGYYSFSISFTINITGNPAQSYAASPYITSSGLTTYTTRFRGSGIQLQPRTITGVVYLLKDQKTQPFYWNLGTNNCNTTVGSNGTIADNQPYIGPQEVVWEYVGN